MTYKYPERNKLMQFTGTKWFSAIFALIHVDEALCTQTKAEQSSGGRSEPDSNGDLLHLHDEKFVISLAADVPARIDELITKLDRIPKVLYVIRLLMIWNMPSPIT